MATTISQTTTTKVNPVFPTSARKKNYTQTVSIALGCLMVVIGLAGILYTEFMGLHMSVMHSLVMFGAGSIAIWAASSRNSQRAYYVDLCLGIFFAINAIAGWMLGTPGTPGVGYDGRDSMLLKIAPGFIELGFVDHVVHTFLCVFFLAGAFSWKRHHTNNK